jgi:predicted double-glycine peptidase
MPKRVQYRTIPAGAIKIDLPNTFQLEGYTCGPAALMAIFAYYGVGPEEEWDLETTMKIDKTGSDPAHIIRAVKRYGLAFEESRPMRVARLCELLDRGRPVMIMVQAWGERDSYAKRWSDGHWIVAIGHDREGVYFEDPALYRTRGFLSFEELETRWHDIEGPQRRKVEHYGIAIWDPKVVGSAYRDRARRIE